MKTYPLSRFVSEVPAELLCPICSEVVDTPKICTECEHLFCEECVHDWARGCPNKCPNGRFTTVPKVVSRILEDLKVRCTSGKCGFVGRLGDVGKHEEECGHLLMRCDNAVCDRKRRGPGYCSKACKDVVALKECVETSTCPETVLRQITKVLKKWEMRCKLAHKQAKKHTKPTDQRQED